MEETSPPIVVTKALSNLHSDLSKLDSLIRHAFTHCADELSCYYDCAASSEVQPPIN